MDILSLGKANKTLRHIQQLDQEVIAPLAESHFRTVDERLDWIEGQANKLIVENSQQIDLSKGTFIDTEFVNGKIQLKQISEGKYTSQGTWESPIIDLGEGWKETKLVDIIKKVGLNSYTSNIIPTMTSATTPSGIVGVSNQNASCPAWKAFDGLNGSTNCWVTNPGVKTGWILYKFPSPKKISKYTLLNQTGAGVGRMPKDWTFEGWDGNQWIVLDTRSFSEWIDGKKEEFTFFNNNSYVEYRFNITANNGDPSYLSIGEIEMMEYILASTSLSIDISSSTDGMSFTPYTPLDSSNSPQARYVKIRATLSAQEQQGEVKNLDFNQSNSENIMTLNEFAEANGNLQLKNHYTQDMTDDGVLGAGKQFSVILNKANFKSIESIGVN